MGLHDIVPFLDCVHALIKLAQSYDVFVCNFIDAMKVCQLQFFWLYSNPYIKIDDPILNELNAFESFICQWVGAQILNLTILLSN
jgi:hypothetical protein